ncbi:hypothetical protein P3T39_007239 [Kitasatospora sp. GP82]|nr:hypothetical protein [Kitasatospora sp. GP82]
MRGGGWTGQASRTVGSVLRKTALTCHDGHAFVLNPRAGSRTERLPPRTQHPGSPRLRGRTPPPRSCCHAPRSLRRNDGPRLNQSEGTAGQCRVFSPDLHGTAQLAMGQWWWARRAAPAGACPIRSVRLHSRALPKRRLGTLLKPEGDHVVAVADLDSEAHLQDTGARGGVVRPAQADPGCPPALAERSGVDQGGQLLVRIRQGAPLQGPVGAWCPTHEVTETVFTRTVASRPGLQRDDTYHAHPHLITATGYRDCVAALTLRSAGRCPGCGGPGRSGTGSGSAGLALLALRSTQSSSHGYRVERGVGATKGLAHGGSPGKTPSCARQGLPLSVPLSVLLLGPPARYYPAAHHPAPILWALASRTGDHQARPLGAGRHALRAPIAGGGGSNCAPDLAR